MQESGCLLPTSILMTNKIYTEVANELYKVLSF